MKFKAALFRFVDAEWDVISVEFFDAEIVIQSGSEQLAKIDNAKKEWKPCVTHCQDLIREFVTHVPPKTEHAKQRIKKATPKLGIIG